MQAQYRLNGFPDSCVSRRAEKPAQSTDRESRVRDVAGVRRAPVADFRRRIYAGRSLPEVEGASPLYSITLVDHQKANTLADGTGRTTLSKNGWDSKLDRPDLSYRYAVAATFNIH